jgi:hypothetical protein
MLVKDIEKVIMLSEKNGWGFGGMALSKRALVHLCRRLDRKDDSFHILELGGGQSTLFWHELSSLDLLPIRVTTLEHHQDWTKKLEKKLGETENITIYTQTLKQITDGEWEEIFARRGEAQALWASYGKQVAENQYDLYTIRNTFYTEIDQLPLENQSIDVMIVDGPHGNGRSLAYPLFCNVLKQDAFLLIDDFDHYPFLRDLGMVFHYEEMYREVLGQERWVLVQLQGQKQEV